MQLAEYLIQRLQESGVTHTFGIPGDYALPFYAAQDRAGMKTVVMTHEPSVGYAADVYARLKGLGVAVVTYGVGALNMVNAVAMAYAEESPLLVIAGAPDVGWQRDDLLFHHRVKSHDTQLRVFREVTVAQASVASPDGAVEQIDEVLSAVRRHSRPGFIEIARDLVFAPVEVPAPSRARPDPTRQEVLAEAVAEMVARLNLNRRLVIYAGVEIERFGLMVKLRELVERLNAPVATSIMSKAVLPERHPNFIGNYFGTMGPDHVRQTVEGADCVLALGMLFSDVDVGFDSSVFPRRRLIQVTADAATISHHRYDGITLGEILDALLAAPLLERHDWMPAPSVTVESPPPANPWGIGAIVEDLNDFLTPSHLAIADTGDCLFASVGLRADHFIGPGYYASMGLAVPGAVGAQLARPDLRPVVLVGDGAFKMTGLELGTAADLKLNPIVILLNNGSFATLRAIDQDRSYYHVRPWDYVGLARALGGDGNRVTDRRQFREALRQGQQRRDFYLIEAVLPSDDASSTLQRLGKQYGGNIRMQASG